MTAIVSALLVLALFLGAWTALSVLAVPILARAVRAQARSNARLGRGLERQGWAAARRR